MSRSNSDVSQGLVVNYSLGGTAENGVNYQTLSGSVVIPAGYTSATVVVQPLGRLARLCHGGDCGVLVTVTRCLKAGQTNRLPRF